MKFLTPSSHHEYIRLEKTFLSGASLVLLCILRLKDKIYIFNFVIISTCWEISETLLAKEGDNFSLLVKLIKLRWNWCSTTLMGIYTNYKQHEKSCLRSHKTAKILSHPYKKFACQERSQWFLWIVLIWAVGLGIFFTN